MLVFTDDRYSCCFGIKAENLLASNSSFRLYGTLTPECTERQQWSWWSVLSSSVITAVCGHSLVIN